MRAMRLVEFGKPLKLQEVPIPKPKGTEVLIKVEGAGVCHSVVHFVDGRFGRIDVKALGLRIPVTPGHEIAGTVAAVGDDVEGVKEGDRVAVDPWIGDGTCHYCKLGEEQLCEHPIKIGENIDGGFAEYVLIPHYRYLYVLRNLDTVNASPLPCAGLTPYRALVRKAQVKPSEYVAVIGAGGGLGTMAIQIAKVMGAIVIGIDVRDEALKEIERAGADYVINGRGNVVEEVRKITGGRGVNVIVDTVGSNETLGTYIDALDKLGRYIILGLYGGDLTYHAPYITQREIQIMGSLTGNLSDFMSVMRLADSGKIRPLVTKVMRLEEANEALDNLRYARVTARQVLVP
ncbi:NAD(P)-dependent alcohol dehydrogenase [Caldivirga maquilingensis]